MNAQGGRCARGAEAIAAVRARSHPVLADARNQPDRLIARGDLLAPVYNVWSRDDGNSCGETPIRCSQADGSVRILGGMVCRMSPVSRAIAALPASRRSVTARLCVSTKRGPAGNCARHVVTDAGDVANTDPAFPSNYNEAIMGWVRDRVGDRPPALDARFGRQGRLVARRGRVRVRCVAGGWDTAPASRQHGGHRDAHASRSPGARRRARDPRAPGPAGHRAAHASHGPFRAAPPAALSDGRDSR